MLQIYRKNIQILLRQAAQFGGEAVAPLHIVNAIQENRTNIRRIKKILREWQVNVTNNVDDEPPDVAAAV